MTTTQPDACGQQRAGSPEMTCYLPVGHPAAHVARWPSGAARAAWIDQEAGTPATAGRVVTAADIRRAETAADLAAERAAHEEHRRQLADALGQDGDADWPYLLRRAEQVVTARATWKNTAANLEADRDRLAAELADVRAAQERYEEEVVGRFNLQAIEDRRRAEKAERAADLLAGSHRRAEQAEAALALATAARDEAIVRAEATLTRVRDALAEVKRDRDLLDLDDEAQTFGDGMTDTLARIEAALGDDQPTPAATKPRITTHTYQGTGGPCAVDFYGQTCDAPRDDHDLIPDTEPELIPVLDYAIHRLFAAIRNALRARP